MKRLLLPALAVAVVAVLASAKLRRRVRQPAEPEGSWEPAGASTS